MKFEPEPPEPDYKEEKIDFKENIVNEFNEVSQTIQPTFGVALKIYFFHFIIKFN